MDVEEQFGITITDDEAVNIRTVGDLQRLVHSRFAASKDGVCYSLPAFLEVRRRTRETAGNSALRIKPSTPIVAILPGAGRRELWRRMEECCSMYPMTLRRPRWLRRLLALLAIAALGAGLYTARIDVAFLPLGILSAFFIVGISDLATKRLQHVPPSECWTFGQLSQRLIGFNTAAMPELSVEEVDERICKIIVDTLGVDADEVIPSARFVEDLQMQ